MGDRFPKALFTFAKKQEQWRRTVRSVDIALENRRVLPGNNLAGKVIIRADKAFDCNRVVLKLKSRERTTCGSGEHRHVEEKTVLSKVFMISEARTIHEGNTEIPFSYKLPRGLPPSYEGWSGNIIHSIEAVVEVDWALDPKLKIDYAVLQQRPPYIQFATDTKVWSRENAELQVRLDDNILRLDKGIQVHFIVDQGKRMNAVRLEIKKLENYKCGWGNKSHESNVREKYIELNNDDWGRWKETIMGEQWKHHLPFTSQLFQVSYYLKVTLEIGWDFDRSVTFPLRFSDVAPEKAKESEVDLFDQIAIDLGMDDW